MKLRTIAIALAFVANTAAAGTIQNADFAAGLDGWTVANSVTGESGYATLTAGAPGVYASLSQKISLNAGDVVTGTAQFFANDYYYYNDHALVKVDDLVLFSSDVRTVGDHGASEATTFTFTAATAGDYTFWAGVANDKDWGNASVLVLSKLAVESKVPEPASLALVGLGLLGALAARRRKA